MCLWSFTVRAPVFAAAALAIGWCSQVSAAPAALYSLTHGALTNGALPRLDPQADGQLSVKTLDTGLSESALVLSGLTPGAAYSAQYHALGAKAGASACSSNGPVTLSFPAFKADAQGRATVKLSAAPARLAGKAGAYVNVQRAAEPPAAEALLCAALLTSQGAPVLITPLPAERVSIIDNAFKPSSLSIKVGDTVTWTHDGQIVHNVKSLSATGPQSGDLRSGQQYSFTFKEAGVYSFYCSYHEGMSGTITVTNR